MTYPWDGGWIKGSLLRSTNTCHGYVKRQKRHSITSTIKTISRCRCALKLTCTFPLLKNLLKLDTSVWFSLLTWTYVPNRTYTWMELLSVAKLWPCLPRKLFIYSPKFGSFVLHLKGFIIIRSNEAAFTLFQFAYSPCINYACRREKSRQFRSWTQLRPSRKFSVLSLMRVWGSFTWHENAFEAYSKCAPTTNEARVECQR